MDLQEAEVHSPDWNLAIREGWKENLLQSLNLLDNLNNVSLASIFIEMAWIFLLNSKN